MDISREDLIQRYSSMEDDSLIQLYLQGTLTPIAYAVIEEELTSRKIPLRQEALKEILLNPPLRESICESKALGLGDDFFSQLSFLATFLVLGIGMFYFANAQNNYLEAFYITCMVALYISPFGIIFSSIGLRFCDKNNLSTTLMTTALILNVIFLFLGIFFNPFTVMGRAFS